MSILYRHAANIGINLDTASCADLCSQGVNLEWYSLNSCICGWF